MAQKVREGESPARIITIEDETFLCYPAFGVNDLNTDNGWAIKRIDATDPDDIKIGWADGTMEKVHNANEWIYPAEGDPGDLNWQNII
jgi:hypothetical protein